MSIIPQNFLSKLLIVVFIVIFMGVMALLTLSFFKPSDKTNVKTKTLPYSISKVWTSIYDRSYYLNSKKEIEKFTIYNSARPQWTEYYTGRDSVENRSVVVVKNKFFSYVSINRKYEQINGFMIRLDSVSTNSTKITIAEKSIFFNNWANIYFRILKPQALINFEHLKIQNTILFMNSNQEKI